MHSGVTIQAMLPEELNTSTETPGISFGDVSLRMHQPLLPKPLAKNAMLIHVRGDIVGQNNGVTVVSRRGTTALFVGKCPLSAKSGTCLHRAMLVCWEQVIIYVIAILEPR